MSINVRLLFGYTALASGIIMTVADLIQLFHVIRGSKNRWLIIVISMLLASNICTIIWWYGYQELLINRHKSELCVWLLGGGTGLQNVWFNLSHYMLADKYRTIAHKVPLKFDGKPEPEATTWDKVEYWSMIALNTLTGILQGYAIVSFRYTTILNSSPPSQA